jgi:hypothetical protein
LTHQTKTYADVKVNKKLNQQILNLMYSILTDWLTLNGTGILNCYDEENVLAKNTKRVQWNDLLMNKFKMFRNTLRAPPEPELCN